MSINYLKEADDPKEVQHVSQSTCLTISISGEDHTLGNAMRSMLSTRLDVQLAGYSNPHPTLQQLNFRLQTLNDKPALQVFSEGADDLTDLVHHVGDVFEKALETYNRQNPPIEPRS